MRAHIRRRQLGNGGWNIYEGGPSDVNASVKALLCPETGRPRARPAMMQEARACILRLGGIRR